MARSVTVAIPVFRRLRYLPEALASVAAQEHDSVDLLVSDNGENGAALEAVLEEHAPRPYRLRRNPRTVPIEVHFDQLVQAAEGEYFVLLADDDRLGANFLAGLTGALDADPDVAVALARMEDIDEDGRPRPRADEGNRPPARMSGAEFVRIWCRGEYRFVTFLTFMGRTDEIRAVGGYPDFPRHGTSLDDALILKLALGRTVAFVEDAVFHNRVYEESHGLSLGWRELAADLWRFVDWLDEDPTLQAYARARPGEWAEVRDLLVRMTWGTYRYRWKYMYRHRLSPLEWSRAAFALPWIPAYYRSVVPHLAKVWASRAKRLLGGRPAAPGPADG